MLHRSVKALRLITFISYISCDVHRQYYRQQEHDHNSKTQNCKKTNGGQAQGRRKRNSQVWQEKEETGKEERSIRQSGFQIDGWVFQS